jgi:uncharacterized protein YjbI with pentapeptide repeats
MDLCNIILYESDLKGASLGYSNLSGADLRSAQLTNARFSHACLRFANIRDVRGVPSDVPTFTDWTLGAFLTSVQ